MTIQEIFNLLIEKGYYLTAFPNSKVCFQASSSQFYTSFDAYYLPSQEISL